MAKERRVGVWNVHQALLILPYQRHRKQTLILKFMELRILRSPASYFLHHMGNNGLHNLDVEVHTISVPCYAKIKHKRMLEMSSESVFCFFIAWGPNSHPPTRLL